MRELAYKNTSFSFVQKFLLERLIELLDKESMDSYRVKLSNPHIIVHELYAVLNDWIKNKVKSHSTFNACKDELMFFLRNDDTLSYTTFSKNVFDGLLEKIKINKDDDRDNKDNSVLLNKLQYALYSLINENKNYLNNLLAQIDDNINKTPELDKDIIPLLIKIDQLVGYLASELIHKGYSKSFLVKFILAIFIHRPESTFNECWEKFKNVIKSENKTKYKIIFKVNVNGAFTVSTTQIRTSILPKEIATSPNSKTIAFLKSAENSRFILIVVDAYDSYKALKDAKGQLANILDKIHFGYSDLKITLRDTALVVNTENPTKANSQQIHFQLDGHYKSDEKRYKNLIDRFAKISQSDFIDKGVEEKIETAIRYLRLGDEALELEQKFISYWIGLEYLFSTYDKDANTFRRLKSYFTTCHLISYIKRNVYELHLNIKGLNLDKKITSFDEALNYLKIETTYNELFELKNEYPLIAFRANRLKSILHNNSEKRKIYLNTHKANLEQHLIRIYRFRNELIHDAALITNIENVTGNLRYYLVFILNKLIVYFSECLPKPMEEKKVRIDDFFLNQELIWDNIVKNKYDTDLLISISYSPEIPL